MALKGKDAAIKALQEIPKLIGQKVETALTRGVAVIVRESDLQVPVDKGNLRASRYILKTGSGMETKIEVGYADPKAVYVHEDLSKAHGEVFNAHHAKDIAAGRTHPRRPTEKAKFLEDPLKDNIDEIRREVMSAFK